MASFRETIGLLDAFVRAIDFDNPPSKDGSMMKTARQLLADARRGDLRPTRWTPFELVTGLADAAYIANAAQRLGVSAEDLRKQVDDETVDVQMYANTRYQVQRRDLPESKVWLSIKRIDQQQATLHSWRDFQRLKNELVGPECEFIELYPAESRLVDTANQYMLWGSSDPQYRFPVGFDQRQVSYESSRIGEGQTPLEQAEGQP